MVAHNYTALTCTEQCMTEHRVPAMPELLVCGYNLTSSLTLVCSLPYLLETVTAAGAELPRSISTSSSLESVSNRLAGCSKSG